MSYFSYFLAADEVIATTRRGVKVDTHWKCHACTFDNEKQSLSCVICGTKRKSGNTTTEKKTNKNDATICKDKYYFPIID